MIAVEMFVMRAHVAVVTAGIVAIGEVLFERPAAVFTITCGRLQRAAVVHGRHCNGGGANPEDKLEGVPVQRGIAGFGWTWAS